MNNIAKIDYNRIFEDTVKNLNEKKRLLLHTCCAPCATAVLERTAPFFDITLFFFNPNIDTEKEYNRRAEELNKLSNMFTLSSIIVPSFEPSVYNNAVKGQESFPEGGLRCGTCFDLRLRETAQMCQKTNNDFFATTLTVSPHKNAALINLTGEQLSTPTASYIPSDFKKKEGYKRSIILSNELGLYRQTYCGCSLR